MSTDAKTATPKRKLFEEDISKMPRMPLYDERQRLWGFFFAEDAAMLKTRTAEEWYRLARKLLADEAGPPSAVSVVIPFVEDSGKGNGKFCLCPWLENPGPPPVPLTAAEVVELCRNDDEWHESESLDDLMDELDQIVEVDDRENGGT